MSDNFVKRNLKRKSFVFKNQPRKRKDASSSRFSRKEPEQNENKEEYSSSGNKGLNGWGIDALALSLKSVSCKPPQHHVTNKLRQPVERREAEFIRGISGIDDNGKKGETGRYSSEEIELFNQCAPNCSGHQMISRMYLVRKTGSNKVRSVCCGLCVSYR
jgi:hypothetical protein